MQLLEGRWYWIKKPGWAPEVAMYGTIHGKIGFHLLLEDDKCYQGPELERIYGEAVNPELIRIYEEHFVNTKTPKLTAAEQKTVRWFTCHNCVVEGCPGSALFGCFRNKMEAILHPVLKKKDKRAKKCSTSR